MRLLSACSLTLFALIKTKNFKPVFFDTGKILEILKCSSNQEKTKKFKTVFLETGKILETF